MRTATPATHKAMRDALRKPPAWFVSACLANPDVGRALQPAYARHRAAEAQWQAMLAPLPSLHDFARPRLAQAIEAKFGLNVNVDRTYLFNARLAADYRHHGNGARDPLATAQLALKQATQSLLHCALQNFDSAQAQPGGLDQDDIQAVVLDSDQFLAFTAQGKPVAIVPHEFAALVRKLDLGGEYQRLVQNVFKPRAVPAESITAAEVMARAKAYERHALLLQTHLALLRGDIDRAWYQALLHLPDATDGRLACGFLTLWQVELTGIVVIGESRARATRPVPVVVYIPDDPVAPLKAYPSTSAFHDALRERLLDPQYLAFFQRFIPARSQATLNEKLQDRLKPWTKVPGKSWYDRLPDPTAKLHLRENPLQQRLLSQLVNQKARRLQDDALFHAVPTAAMDELALEHRLAYFAQGTLQVLNVAAFFVPGLGAAMLGIAALQLGYEVYEGIESWARDEQDQALGYLLNVVENLALITALGAAGAADAIPATQTIPVEAPSFIEDLGPVEMPDGSTRLWKPDLQPFAHDILLPPGLVADANGVYAYQGKFWLALDDRLYQLKPTSLPDQYRLAHPTRVESYQPPIRHNGGGAWLHALDRPLEWSGAELLRRMGPLAATLDETTAARLFSICDTSEAVVRRALADSTRLPAQLEDTLWRYRLDAELPAGVSGAERSRLFNQAYARLQATTRPDAMLLQRVYPDLPFTLRDEVLRGATAAELSQLAAGKIPLRLAEEIRACQPRVRLARALEGLLIPAAANTDFERLGPLIRQTPLPPRPVLRQALNLPAAVPGYLPPMRLASGRLGYLLSGRGAMSGYVLRETLLDTLRMLDIEDHVQVPVERILQALEETGLPRDQILQRLQQVLDERMVLEQVMGEWSASSAALIDLDARAGSRTRTGRAIWHHWYANCLPEISQIHAPLRLMRTFLEDFPSTLPAFFYQRTRSLQLVEASMSPASAADTLASDWQQLVAFLARFPHLSELEISRPLFMRPDFSVFALSISQVALAFPELTTLRFINQGAAILSLDLHNLGRLQRLRHLDLSGNTLALTEGTAWPGLTLNYLGLDHMGWQHWPAWLDNAALARIAEISLQDNALTTLPDLLLDNPAGAPNHTRILLAHNRLSILQTALVPANPGGPAHRYALELGTQDDPASLVSRWRREQRQLREMLDHWALDTGTLDGNSAPQTARRSAINAMLLHFRSAAVQADQRRHLVLDDIALADFPPRLPGFISDELYGLTLTRAEASAAELDALLRRFPNLSRLHIEGPTPGLDRLPAALSALPNLQELTCAWLGMEIDQQTLEALVPLSRLSTLDFTGNRMGDISHVPVALIPRINRLYLNRCALQHWPTWVAGFARLRVLGLDGNLITGLPPAILANPITDQLLLEVSLRDNPLTHETMEQAYLSEGNLRRYAFVMDLPDDIRRLPQDNSPGSYSISSPSSSHGSDSEDDAQTPAIEPWLVDTLDENQVHRQTWSDLQQSDEGSTLLRLVERLRHAAPFRDDRLRPGFARRVWQVLQSAGQDARQRALYSAMASDALLQADGTQTCLDGAQLVFNQIELHLFNERALQNLPDTGRGPALYRLTRSLYRMQALDDIALQRLNGRDEAEVRLAYRMRLAEELDLPVPAGNMLYEATAAVSSLELSQVLMQVQQGEQGQAMLDFAAANPAWVEYLRSAFAPRFADVAEHYRLQVDSLPDLHPDQTLEQLGPRFAALERDHVQREQALIRELTKHTRQHLA